MFAHVVGTGSSAIALCGRALLAGNSRGHGRCRRGSNAALSFGRFAFSAPRMLIQVSSHIFLTALRTFNRRRGSRRRWPEYWEPQSAALKPCFFHARHCRAGLLIWRRDELLRSVGSSWVLRMRAIPLIPLAGKGQTGRPGDAVCARIGVIPGFCADTPRVDG